MQNHKIKNGFTLVEISVVLIIIGLLFGGILVGQDLIRAAKIRQQISQVEKINTALNTFRIKYNTTPGDLTASEADGFGFVARSGARGHGDGNGVLEPCNPAVAFQYITFPIGCETALVWSDLAFANLIAGQYIGTDANMNVASLVLAKQYMPATPAGDGVLMIVADAYNKNALVGTMYHTAVTAPAFKVSDAYAIDAKMDDGKPAGGGVTAVQRDTSFPGVSGPGLFTEPSSFAGCVSSGEYAITAGDAYNFCSLRFPLASK